MTESERVEQLLSEIRDLLADRDKRYDEYLANSSKRNEELARAWHDKIRYWSFVFWAGAFVAVFAGTSLAITFTR
jgi:hypothetical protein